MVHHTRTPDYRLYYTESFTHFDGGSNFVTPVRYSVKSQEVTQCRRVNRNQGPWRFTWLWLFDTFICVLSLTHSFPYTTKRPQVSVLRGTREQKRKGVDREDGVHSIRGRRKLNDKDPFVIFETLSFVSLHKSRWSFVDVSRGGKTVNYKKVALYRFKPTKIAYEESTSRVRRVFSLSPSRIKMIIWTK